MPAVYSLLWYMNLYICTNTCVRLLYINACGMFLWYCIVQLNSLIVISFNVCASFNATDLYSLQQNQMCISLLHLKKLWICCCSVVKSSSYCQLWWNLVSWAAGAQYQFQKELRHSSTCKKRVNIASEWVSEMSFDSSCHSSLNCYFQPSSLCPP